MILLIAHEMKTPQGLYDWRNMVVGDCQSDGTKNFFMIGSNMDANLVHENRERRGLLRGRNTETREPWRLFCEACWSVGNRATGAFRSFPELSGTFRNLPDLWKERTIGFGCEGRRMTFYLKESCCYSSSSVFVAMATQTKVDTAQALLIGTLAPGVNAPTWAAWNIVMLALALSLGALLCIALGSSSMALLGHVFLLMSLAGVLFALLSWFMSETGFVSVEDQMKDLNLGEKEEKEKDS